LVIDVEAVLTRALSFALSPFAGDNSDALPRQIDAAIAESNAEIARMEDLLAEMDPKPNHRVVSRNVLGKLGEERFK
jgi:hypothetical protein